MKPERATVKEREGLEITNVSVEVKATSGNQQENGENAERDMEKTKSSRKRTSLKEGKRWIHRLKRQLHLRENLIRNNKNQQHLVLV